MKHPEKRFLGQTQFSDGLIEGIEKATKNAPPHPYTIDNMPDSMVPYLFDVDNYFYKAFLLEVDGLRIVVPEPDPILVYFDSGYANFRELEHRRPDLVKKLIATANKESGPPIVEMFSFFNVVSAFAIYLCTAVEATMNRAIPRDYTYKKPNGTRVYDKPHIERYFRAEEKLNNVLKEITNKRFEESYPNDFKLIQELEQFRNDIVHTKEIAVGTEPAKHNFTRALQIDYKNTIEAVKSFCNFYIGGEFIVDCPCPNPA